MLGEKCTCNNKCYYCITTTTSDFSSTVSKLRLSRSELGLGKLPTELLKPIFDQCGRSDLFSLLKVSRAAYRAVISILYQALYHDIDFSVHNDEEPEDAWALKQKYDSDKEPTIMLQPPCIWPDSFRRAYRDTEKCLRRQYYFIRTLSRRPALGHLVARLTWSLVIDDIPCRSWLARHKEFIRLSRPYWGTRWPALSVTEAEEVAKGIGSAFGSLNNVRIVDLYGLYFRPIHAMPTEFPKTLFPSATHITLGGCLSFPLAKSILDGCDPTRLKSLSFNNLVDEGQLSPTEAIPCPRDFKEFEETWEVDGSRKAILPEPMRNLLRPLTGCCPRLQQFAYSGAGEEFDWANWEKKNKKGNVVFHTSELVWPQSAEHARYKELADFLNSVRESLVKFKLELGLSYAQHFCERGYEESRFGPKYTFRDRDIISDRRRPMDEKFIEYVLPVLIDQRWPKLENLEIRGTSRKVDCEAFDNDIWFLIKAAFSSNVCMLGDHDAQQPFDNWTVLRER
ncbi:MAG: hypothetical protein M1814_004229 [Vezdaea aestivalis]|nr:MAG: hypothetical protein M1814_004229 [Vezdaea aestivalis]